MKAASKKAVVLKYYPDAIPVNIGCNSGDYYHIKSGIFTLGEGKTKIQAWVAAYKHINSD